MRHTLLLVAALGLIAAAGPSALAQDQDKTTQPPATPATSEPATQPATPSALPATYTQPVMPGQVVSPYAPAYSPVATPCGYIMPSAYVPGTVMFGSQYQPLVTNGSVQRFMPSGQPIIQYGQPTAMPAVGSVTGGVISQPVQTGTVITNGQTFQPYQTGMVYSSGIPSQPIQSGVVYQTGALGTYSNQPMILSGYAPSYSYGGGYGYDFGRRGYNPGGLGGPRSGLGVRPGLGFGGFGLRR